MSRPASLASTLTVVLWLAASCATTTEPSPSATPADTPTNTVPDTTVATTSSPPEVASTVSTEPIAPPTSVTAPGAYTDAFLTIKLGFRSEVADFSSQELQATALAILNQTSGWRRSGFEFEADPDSELVVVLAEGPRVDEMCLPLDTGGIVNCQNGPVVALNADRWRSAFDGWDSTLDDYRTYVINHEVGHLIGLRHPDVRCPTVERVAAAMEPQTTNLAGCIGNGSPLDWEIEWAKNRPATIGPDPDWDGPRPVWGLGSAP